MYNKIGELSKVKEEMNCTWYEYLIFASRADKYDLDNFHKETLSDAEISSLIDYLYSIDCLNLLKGFMNRHTISSGFTEEEVREQINQAGGKEYLNVQLDLWKERV